MPCAPNSTATAPPRCVLAEPGATAEQVAARDEEVLARLRAGPITFARRATTELGHAHLVEIDGHGHSPINACTRPPRAAYLIDLELLAPGTVCTPDRPPFPD